MQTKCASNERANGLTYVLNSDPCVLRKLNYNVYSAEGSTNYFSVETHAGMQLNVREINMSLPGTLCAPVFAQQ